MTNLYENALSRGFGCLLIACSWLFTACYQTPDEAELRIKIVDISNRDAPVPLAGALVSIEAGGLYLYNPDPSVGNPAYVHGARAGSAGTLSMTVPTGELGIHTFTSGYYYGSRFVDFDQELGITINMEPFRDPKPAAPTIASPELSPATVAPGEVFVVRADVKAGNAKDPLSEEVIVIHPRSGTSRALDPPSAGVQGKAYPDGIWKTTLTAPSEPGTYEYFLAATSEGCVTSDIPPALVLQVQ